MEKTLIKKLVDKFLCWHVPDSVFSDLCMTSNNPPYSEKWGHHRNGTSIMNAIEAEQMIEHLFGDKIAEIELREKLIAKHMKYLSDHCKMFSDMCKVPNKITDEELLRSHVWNAAYLHAQMCFTTSVPDLKLNQDDNG